VCDATIDVNTTGPASYSWTWSPPATRQAHRNGFNVADIWSVLIRIVTVATPRTRSQSTEPAAIRAVFTTVKQRVRVMLGFRALTSRVVSGHSRWPGPRPCYRWERRTRS